MKNIFYFLSGFIIFGGSVLFVEFVKADTGTIDNYDVPVMSGKIAYGLYLNQFTGTKVAVCLNDPINCDVVYLPFNSENPRVELNFIRFKKPVPEYLYGQRNKLYDRLFQPSAMIF